MTFSYLATASGVGPSAVDTEVCVCVCLSARVHVRACVLVWGCEPVWGWARPKPAGVASPVTRSAAARALGSW